MTNAPWSITWTDHAFVKASLLGIARADVEDVVLQHHDERTRNGGAGDWEVVAHGLTVIYNHPDRGDRTVARVVTLWRQR